MDMAISTMNKVFNSQPFRTPLHVSSRGYSLLAGMLNYGMLAVLALILAYWIWQLAAPAALPAVAANPLINREAVATITARHWFGGDNTGIPGVPPENALNIKLVGIFGAAKSKKQAGFAIFQLKDGKQVYAMLNQEITPGLKLTGITANAVTVEQDGLQVKIVLEEKAVALEIPRIKSR